MGLLLLRHPLLLRAYWNGKLQLERTMGLLELLFEQRLVVVVKVVPVLTPSIWQLQVLEGQVAP